MMAGRTVLQYQLGEKLGAGGSGEVYKALDTRLNRFVAIKVLSAGPNADPESRRRFIHEAQAASALNHPNIITIYDVIDDGRWRSAKARKYWRPLSASVGLSSGKAVHTECWHIRKIRISFSHFTIASRSVRECSHESPSVPD